MRRLTDLFKGLMFLDGHFTRPDDVDALAPLGHHVASTRFFAGNTGDPSGVAGLAPPESDTFSLLQQLQFLGGRPMHTGHNLDIDEPFEQLAANDDAALRECTAC